MEKLNKAREILEENDASLVIIDEEIRIFNDIGVKRLMILLEENENLKNSVVADNVVGKAAAFLYLKLEAKNIFAKTISEAGYLL